jgi:AmmeMemoRadiSam system protein A
MHPLAKLAKNAVETYIQSGEAVSPPLDLPREYLDKKAGAFVSLHIGKELRGCIGTSGPTKDNIALEVIANAIAAASEDPRFEPLTKKDLANLSYEVYILEKPEPVKSLDELDPKKFGVIVFGIRSRRSALLLPGLEGIDTVEQQLGCITQKAGIDPSKENLAVQKFLAQKFD